MAVLPCSKLILLGAPAQGVAVVVATMKNNERSRKATSDGRVKQKLGYGEECLVDDFKGLRYSQIGVELACRL